ncbi:MAG: tetratricopeptide repeat protein, partial [Acidobacteriaceae bacterium]
MFASRNRSPLDHRPFRCRASILLTAFLACTIPSALCAPTSSCTKPATLATRLQTHPDAQAWTDLGNWFGEHKQFACAQQAFRSGLRLNPGSAQLNYLLGLSLYESQNFTDAVTPLQRSIHADAAVLKPHLLLASVYARLARPADAESEWHAALQIDPSSGMALHGLSQSFLAREDFPDEMALLHSTKLDEDLAIDLAVACSRNGQLEEAASVLAHTMESFPNSVKLSNALVALYI